MSLLSPSGLETDTYECSGWHQIFNKDMDMINRLYSMLQNLLDVDTDNLQDGAILTWDASANKWKARTYG